MAKAASRATNTVLKIGRVQVPVGLFSTVEKPGKLAVFVTAGPHGGVLKAESRARAVPGRVARDETPDVAEHSNDPFGPGAVSEPWSAEHETHAGAVAAGDPVAIDAGVMADTVAPEVFARGRMTVAPETREAPAVAAVDGEYGRVLVEEGTGEVVAPDQVRRGVRLADGRFIDCTERLAQIEERTRLECMEVVGFVDVTRVPRYRVKGAQYVGAGDGSALPALRLLFEGLRVTRRAAVVKVTKRSRQTLGIIAASAGVLMLFELVWSEDVREAPDRATAIHRADANADQLRRMIALIGAMGAPVDVLDDMRDDAIEMRERLYAQAAAGELEPDASSWTGVVDLVDDLMQQLEESLGVSD